MGSSEPIKLLYHFESDQVYDFWLIQPKIILIWCYSQIWHPGSKRWTIPERPDR
jgi:hypothetical protein